jgi:hypothetical protein
VQVCAAVNPSSLGESSGQRWYRKDHTDIQWFRRGLVCKECGDEWLTAELPEGFLDELVELRDALKEIKQNAEMYVKESDKASVSLRKLSSSLSVLRALKSYKTQ